MSSVLLVMLFAPLLGSIVNGLALRPRSSALAGLIASSAAGVSFVCALFLFGTYASTSAPIVVSFDWFKAGALDIKWGFSFDALTAMMALVVTGIGTLIHVYSIGYMSHDKSPARYFAYLNLFLFNMLILITGDSLPVLFVGWEGVGLCSYLLIGFWFEDPQKAKAGMKAFLVNRIGDAGFLMGVFLCYTLFESVNFREMAAAMQKLSPEYSIWFNLAAVFLFVGAMGKSAQIPLYVWLPDAMAGPTPVSALIHAATMVTAGIYLIARMGFLFAVAEQANVLIATIGVSTAVFAALIGTSQRDIKKVLAYSTVSQLGLMFLALGSRAYFAAVFHLMTHAFFKALMFLGAGSVIHALDGEQDIYNMGGLKKKLPYTFATFAIGTVAICGIPPFAGFFSKDSILFDALAGRGVSYWLLGLFASGLTAFYMTRVFVLTFLGEYRGKAHPHESPAVMTIPLAALAVGSVVAGWIGMPHGLHLLPNYLEHFLNHSLSHVTFPTAPIPELLAMAIATAIAAVGMSIGYVVYRNGPLSEKPFLRPLQTVFASKFWIDELYEILFVRPFGLISGFLAKIVDKKIIDGLVHVPGYVSRGGAAALSLFQIGSVQFYLLVMLIGGFLVLWITLKGGL